MLLLIENKQELQLLEDKKLKYFILLILQFKDLRTKKLKKKDNKVYKEFLIIKIIFRTTIIVNSKIDIIIIRY